MSTSDDDNPGNNAIALKTDGNPEGKGVNAFMLDWHQSRPCGVVAKPKRQLLAEFFTSMLVLSAQFRFRPVVGNTHYLYWIAGNWSLSLISPEEWSDARRDAFAGTCELHPDMTWTMTPADTLTKENPVTDALSRIYDAFASTLDTERTLEDILPFYVAKMPYYQRLYASALSRSVQAAMGAGNQMNLSGKTWHSLLPDQSCLLLEQHG